MRITLFYIFIVFSLLACMNSGPDVSNIKLEHTIARFDKDLFTIDTTHLEEGIEGISLKYGAYWKLYNQGIIRTGDPSQPDLALYIKRFVCDKNIREVYDSCAIIFADDKKLNKDIVMAFKYLKYYYPKVDIPQVYFHLSGFSQSLVVDKGIISVSIDNYLGKNSKFYNMLATPVPMYARSSMEKDRVPLDILKAFALTNFSFAPQRSTFVSNIIYKGKILYFLSKVFPNYAESIIMSYTKDQLSWCRLNEEMSWGFFIENNYLYSSDHFIISKYINNAPYTSGMPTKSPGRVANWLGLQIVKSYMRSNDVSLYDLMKNNDYEGIFRESNYQPQ